MHCRAKEMPSLSYRARISSAFLQVVSRGSAALRWRSSTWRDIMTAKTTVLAVKISMKRGSVAAPYHFLHADSQKVVYHQFGNLFALLVHLACITLIMSCAAEMQDCVHPSTSDRWSSESANSSVEGRWR